jgi:sulfiredoxin
MRIEAIPIKDIQRPLYRQNDQAKVEALMQSIQEIGLQEPIDVLEVDGKYYGFSGCHRYEACTRLGHETILCKVRRAPRSILKMHLA